MNNIEIVATLRCKICGDIVSLGVPLVFEKATEDIREFKEKHKHPTETNQSPWMI